MGAQEDEAKAPKKGLKFYLIVLSLAFTGLLTALEATITSTALPTIIGELGGADLYIWVINSYFLTTTAFQPLYGQLANLFGRRYPIIFATATFTLGSGICGGANNISMLIAGRAIQGIGAGGVNVLIEVVICDLVPLRERGNLLALIFGLVALGTALGPVFGGLIVQYSSWRWVFYLNLPVGGAALVLLVLFLQVKYEKETSFMSKLKRIDWIGTVIFVAAVTSLLIALSWAGAVYPWSSYRVIIPLVLGIVGFAIFLVYQGSPLCTEPTMPLRLFSNRTSLIAFLLTFFHSVTTIWVVYFLPVYFQGVLVSTPARSGIQLLPTVLILIPFAAAGGGLVARFGRYRPIHHLGFAILTIGFGLLSLLDARSSTAAWVIFQGIEAAGAGLIIPTLLPAVQAELIEADTALATATWAFVRSFGLIWGATVPAAVFNNRFGQVVDGIENSDVVAALMSGQGYEHATKQFLDSLPADGVVRGQVISAFSEALQRTWQIGIAFGSVAFLLVFVEREIALRKELETQFGIEEEKEKEKVMKDLPEENGEKLSN